MSHLVEVLGWGIHVEKTFPNKEDKVQESLELECLAVACALNIFAGYELEVESQLDQVGDVVGLRVRGGNCRGHNGVNDSQGGIFSRLTGGSLIL